MQNKIDSTFQARLFAQAESREAGNGWSKTHHFGPQSLVSSLYTSQCKQQMKPIASRVERVNCAGINDIMVRGTSAPWQAAATASTYGALHDIGIP
jgi:hypothetical protein